MKPIVIVFLVGVLVTAFGGTQSAAVQNPWETPEGCACFEQWAGVTIRRMNTYDGGADYNARKPWRISRYGVLEANAKDGTSTDYAPSNWAQYGGNMYKYMWDYWHAPGGVWGNPLLRAAGVPHIRPYIGGCLSTIQQRESKQQPLDVTPSKDSQDGQSLPIDDSFKQFMTMQTTRSEGRSGGGVDAQLSGDLGSPASEGSGGQYGVSDLRDKMGKLKGSTGTSSVNKEASQTEKTGMTSQQSVSAGLTTQMKNEAGAVVAKAASDKVQELSKGKIGPISVSPAKVETASKKKPSTPPPKPTKTPEPDIKITPAIPSSPAVSSLGAIPYYLVKGDAKININDASEPCTLTAYLCVQCNDEETTWLSKIAELIVKKYGTEFATDIVRKDQCVNKANVTDVTLVTKYKGPSKVPIPIPTPSILPPNYPCSNGQKFQEVLQTVDKKTRFCIPHKLFLELMAIAKRGVGS